MKKGRRGAVLGDCLRKNRVAILLWVLTVLTEWVVFYLYRIMWEPLLYAGVLTLAVGLLLLGLDLRREMQAARERLRLREAILTEWNDLPEEKTLEQADYGDMIRKLGRQLRQETATQEAQRRCPGLPVLCSGGVASNRQLRAAMERSCGALFAQPCYSTDNAMGIAVLTALQEGV